MSVVIRAARLSDAPDVARLTLQLGYDLSEPAAADRLSRILSRPDQEFLIADAGGRAVGWLHLLLAEYIETGTFVVVGGLVVDRDHRGRGIGRMLLQEAESRALARGCPVVRLWSTVSRTAAHRFYEKEGYQKVKTQHSFVKVLDPSADVDLSRFAPRVDS